MENENNNKPMISVVMISYNHQVFIEESLMSVVEQQSDSYDLEILIVDDGSSDDTQKIISSVQEKYPDLIFPTFKEHAGITAINKNLNEQIKKARGEYIAFLAGDDKYLPNRFEKQLEAFKKDDLVELVISNGKNFDLAREEFLNSCQEEVIVRMLQEGNESDVYEYITTNVPTLLIQGFLVKKSMLEAIDFFDESVIADDWVLNIRIFQYLTEHNKKAMYIEDVVFQRNIHGENTSRNIDDHSLRIMQVVDKYISPTKQKHILKKMHLNFFILCVRRKMYQKSLSHFYQYQKNDFFMRDLFLLITNKIAKKLNAK
ncbi:glycosyltransferase [Flexistipes sinusarabici]|nr:glycosyltransferase [Flexistipes sinusarabici]